MGKNTKRKQRRKAEASPLPEQQQQQHQQHEGPSIVLKLRHNDPKIRHAALAALVHTSSKMHPSTVQAVRDQLMDRTHTECASMAAACLSNFLAFALEEEHALTAGWVLLLVERLRDCYSHIESSSTTSTTTLSLTQLYLVWELAERCWTCLTHLVENNPLAMERMLRSAALRQDTMKLLFQYLHFTSTHTVEHQHLSEAVQIMASRCLHSIWDDNDEFILAWVEDPTAQQSLELLVTFLRNASTTARLHAIGAWCSFWSLTCQHSYEWGTLQPLSVLADCLTILQQTLIWDVPARSVQLSQLVALYQAHQQNQADEVLEKQIVSEQQKKNEPAKQIARRLKQMKDARGAKDDSTKEVADSSMGEEQTVDWESGLEQWLSSIRPLQLALEITANLTSGVSMVANEAEEDEDELMVDSQTPLNAELLQLLLDTSFPDGIVDLMKNLYQPLWGDDRLVDIPEDVRNSIGELQSKAVVCIGRCITALQDNHRQWNVDVLGLWNYLKLSFQTAVNDNATESLCATMAMSLQSARGNTIIRSLELTDIELLLRHLQQTTSVVAARDIIFMLGAILCSSSERDGFRFHTAEVNQAVAKSLLELGTSSAEKKSPMVLSETLRVLMDIYGNDDCYPQIFDSLHILGYFQTSVPALKQSIHLSRDVNLDDLEQWKETASNASRFIQYKKGYGN